MSDFNAGFVGAYFHNEIYLQYNIFHCSSEKETSGEDHAVLWPRLMRPNQGNNISGLFNYYSLVSTPLGNKFCFATFFFLIQKDDYKHKKIHK